MALGRPPRFQLNQMYGKIVPLAVEGMIGPHRVYRYRCSCNRITTGISTEINLAAKWGCPRCRATKVENPQQRPKTTRAGARAERVARDGDRRLFVSKRHAAAYIVQLVQDSMIYYSRCVDREPLDAIVARYNLAKYDVLRAIQRAKFREGRKARPVERDDCV